MVVEDSDKGEEKTDGIPPPLVASGGANVDGGAGDNLQVNATQRRNSTGRKEVSLLRRMGGYKGSISAVLNTVVTPALRDGIVDAGDYERLEASIAVIRQQLEKLSACADLLPELPEIGDEKLVQLSLYMIDVDTQLRKTERMIKENRAPRFPVAERSYGQENKASEDKPLAPVVARLPVLELVKFGGKKESYEVFWQSFQASIDQRSDLSSLVKFQYLRSVVTDEALEEIEHLPLLSENYSKACLLLQERYDKPYIRQQGYIRELLELSGWQKCHTYESINKLYKHVTRHALLLEQTDISVDSISIAVVSYMLKLLPDKIVDKHLGLVPSGNLDDLLHLVQKHLEKGERKEAVLGKAITGTGRSDGVKKSVFATSQEKVSAGAGPDFCFLCSKSGHVPLKCKEYIERNEVFRLCWDRCHNCFNKGHLAMRCYRPKDCNKCTDNHKHHRRLCVIPDRQDI